MKYLNIIFLIFITLASCEEDQNDDLASKQDRLVELEASIDVMIADKSCNGAGDCASIAFGSKPCGGPWSYLIYAASTVDVPTLEAMVAEYNQLQEEVNELTNAVSDCAYVQEPVVNCGDDLCEAQ